MTKRDRPIFNAFANVGEKIVFGDTAPSTDDLLREAEHRIAHTITALQTWRGDHGTSHVYGTHSVYSMEQGCMIRLVSIERADVDREVERLTGLLQRIRSR